MISIPVALLIIAIHFFADFMCQSDEMAVNKSKSNYWLTIHVTVYSTVTFLGWLFCFFQPSYEYMASQYLEFTLFIFATHWITDYCTSRLSSKYFGKNEYHWGFVVVGFDQVLHYIQLLSAYYIFIKQN